MGVTGAERAIIFDDATDDYIDVRLIEPQSRFEMQGVGEEDIDGNQLWIEDQAYLNLAFFDDADVAQLKTWQRDRTKLKITVIGVQDYIFWDRPSTILVTEPNDFKPRGRNVTRIVVRAKGDELPIERSPGYELLDSSEEVLEGFIGSNATSDGVTANSLPGATFGADGNLTWTVDGVDYVIDTTILNTLN